MLKTQQATEAEAALNHLFQGTPDPMLIVDAKGQVLQSNQLAQQLFGVVALQLPGVHISNLLRLESDSSSMQQFAALLSGLSDEEPLIVPARAADGEVRILSVTYAKTWLGRSAVFIMNLRDVTGRLAEQAALEFAKEQAEQALQRQQEMQQQLINAEKMASLSKMVAGVAHEVNTPLGVMLTASSLLHDDTLVVFQLFNDATLSKSRLQQYLDIARETTTLIRDTCLQTGELISHFKQVAVDQSGTERRRFNLPKYLQELLVTLAPAWESSGVVVRLDGPVLLEMDSFPGAVAQVVTNLLMNALQHAYQPDVGGEVIIAIAANPASTGWVDIMVRDEGAGIDSAEQSQVFEPFFTTTRVKGNTGLGLHIVYSTVQMVLRGQITLDSTLGQGCTFKVSLPLCVDGANLPSLLHESSVDQSMSAYQSESIGRSEGSAQQQDDESARLPAPPAKLPDVLPTATVLPLRAS